MINITKMKLFPAYNQQISIPNNDDLSYNIIFMSENENFLNVYPKLMIRRQFAKKVTIAPAKQPRLVVTMKDLIPYKKKLGLIPHTRYEKGNTFFPMDEFLNKIDSAFGKESYKKPQVMKRVSDYFDSIKTISPNKNILMYHVNFNKHVPQLYMNRRSMILNMLLKLNNGTLPFDTVTLVVERDGKIKYFNIQTNDQKPLPANRMISIIKGLSPHSDDVVTESLVLESCELCESAADIDKKSILNAIAKYQKKKILKS